MKKLLKYVLIVTAISIVAISCTPKYTPIEDLPAAYVNFSIDSSDNDFRIPTKIRFINLSTIPDSVYGEPEFTWNFGDGIGTSNGADTVYYTYTKPGEYEVSLIAHAPKLEPDTIKIPLTIKPLYEYIFSENFEGYNPDEFAGDSLSNSWVVIDNDEGVPGDTVLFNKAWKVAYNSIFRSNVAVANSYYVSIPVPDADDWLISPKIALSETDSFSIQWKAMSLTKSGSFPDSYQVYISNTTQDVAGCTYLLKEVVDEWWSTSASDVTGKGIHYHKYDLSEFAGDTIHFGFRLMTPAPGGSQLAIDSIVVTRYFEDKGVQ